MQSKRAVVLLAVLLTSGIVWADGDDDPQTRREAQGQWVLTTNQVTPSANQPQNYNIAYYDVIFGVIYLGRERTAGSASGSRPLTLTMDGEAESLNAVPSSITNTGSASLTEIFQWTWTPSSVPIQNKDVLMQITGTCTVEAAVQISGNDGGDSASAAGSFTASASGSVGGNEIVNASSNNKKIEVEAFIDESTIKYRYKISGEAKKNKGGGSVDADASMDEYQEYNGNSGQAKSLSISANVAATANTNNVGVYGISLTQSISGSISAGCSGFDKSTVSLSATSNWDIAPRP